MAMMLIDKTKDSACKSAEADAIRAKTGGSAQIAYDWANSKGYADAIAAIPAGGSGLKYDTGTFTLPSGNLAATPIAIAHNLGTVPKVVIIWTDAYSASSPPTAASNVGYIYLAGIVNAQQKSSGSAVGDYPLFAWIGMNTSGQLMIENFSNANYTITAASVPTASSFYLVQHSSSRYWRGSITYRYFVAEGWWT